MRIRSKKGVGVPKDGCGDGKNSCCAVVVMDGAELHLRVDVSSISPVTGPGLAFFHYQGIGYSGDAEMRVSLTLGGIERCVVGLSQ